MAYSTAALITDDLDQIEGHIDLSGLIGEYIEMDRKGKAHCPFHQDDSPSFQVYRDHWHCFGCHEHGGAIKFIQKIRSISFKDALEIIKEKANIWANTTPVTSGWNKRHQDKDVSLKAEWQAQEWQGFAEAELSAAKVRMTAKLFKEFETQRGLKQVTAQHFEIGWTGDNPSKHSVKINGQSRFLMIPARCWIFPRRNAAGKIEQLKWRDPSKNKAGKYGQLVGSQTGLFNLEGARQSSQEITLLCTGEFEVMLLKQFGIEASCHTGGEGASLDIDKFFGTTKPVFYISDNDSAGKQAASRRHSDCPRLKVCYPQTPHKDLTEQYLSGPDKLTKEDILRILGNSLGQPAKLHVRGKTYRVETNGDPLDTENTTDNENFVELEEARLKLALSASHFYHYPLKSRTSVLQIKAQPGVGKGHAFNEEATRRSFRGDGTTIWLAPRKNMYHDQERADTDWKLIEGRKAAVDREGNRVDFDDPNAVIAGNCTAQGEAYHQIMAQKKWERESHEYCEACPLRKRCDEKGYYSKLKKDGRNAFANFKHMFTTIPLDYRFLVIDEPRFQDFVDVQKIDTADLIQIRHYNFNLGMDSIIRLIGELLARPRLTSSRPGEDPGETVPQANTSDFDEENLLTLDDLASVKTNPNLTGEIIPGAGGRRFKAAWQLSGRELYLELDQLSREMNGRGLLALIDQAEAVEGPWLRHEVRELLDEKTPEAAQKLPKNVWQPLGPKPAPGTGGIYDIIKEEAAQVLGGQLDFEFVSRLEMVGPPAVKPGPGVLFLHRRNYLPADIAKKPIAVLDATGDTNLLRELLSYYENVQFGDREYRQRHPIWKRRVPNITVVNPRVELPVGIDIVQKSRRNNSKTSLLQSLNRDGQKRYWQSYLNDILLFLKKREQTLIVCCKALKSKLIEELEKRGINAQAGYYFSVENYGSLRGSNAFKDYDCVIEAGMYGPQPEAIVAAGRALFGGDGNQLTTDRSRQRQLYPTRLEDGSAMADDVLVFDDPRLQILMEQEQVSEYLQIAYRIRLLNVQGNKCKRVVLLFAQPVPGMPVHNLITEDEGGENLEDLTNPRTLKIVQKLKETAELFIQEAKEQDLAPHFSAQMLAEKSGVSLTSTYKYFDQVVLASNMERQCYMFTEKMPSGKDKESKADRRRLRTLVFATPMGIPQKEIMFIILFGKMPIPANWSDPRPEELKAIPELEEPIVLKPEEVNPEFQGEVAVRLAGLNQLAAEYATAIATDMRFSARAAIIREQYIEFDKQLSSLVRRHAPRGPRQSQEVA